MRLETEALPIEPLVRRCRWTERIWWAIYNRRLFARWLKNNQGPWDVMIHNIPLRYCHPIATEMIAMIHAREQEGDLL